MKKKQSIPNITRVQFKINGMFHELAESMEITQTELLKLNNMKGQVLSLETYSELGEKDFEYYNVALDNGVVLDAISGYHLEVIK